MTDWTRRYLGIEKSRQYSGFNNAVVLHELAISCHRRSEAHRADPCDPCVFGPSSVFGPLSVSVPEFVANDRPPGVKCAVAFLLAAFGLVGLDLFQRDHVHARMTGFNLAKWEVALLAGCAVGDDKAEQAKRREHMWRMVIPCVRLLCPYSLCVHLLESDGEVCAAAEASLTTALRMPISGAVRISLAKRDGVHNAYRIPCAPSKVVRRAEEANNFFAFNGEWLVARAVRSADGALDGVLFWRERTCRQSRDPVGGDDDDCDEDSTSDQEARFGGLVLDVARALFGVLSLLRDVECVDVVEASRLLLDLGVAGARTGDAVLVLKGRVNRVEASSDEEEEGEEEDGEEEEEEEEGKGLSDGADGAGKATRKRKKKRVRRKKKKKKQKRKKDERVVGHHALDVMAREKTLSLFPLASTCFEGTAQIMLPRSLLLALERVLKAVDKHECAFSVAEPSIFHTLGCFHCAALMLIQRACTFPAGRAKAPGRAFGQWLVSQVPRGRTLNVVTLLSAVVTTATVSVIPEATAPPGGREESGAWVPTRLSPSGLALHVAAIAAVPVSVSA